jgi:thioredoxin reductase
MKNGTIVDIQFSDGSLFVSTDAAGNRYTSRKVVLGTGIKDLVPSTPGLQENWANGIFWCPWCDGYEHRDQPLGILGPIDKILGNVEEIRTLNTDIIAFVNGTLTNDNVQALDATTPYWQKTLEAYNVKLENRTIAAIERIQNGAVVNSAVNMAEYDKFNVKLVDGTEVERGAFFTAFPSVQRSNLGQQMGVRLSGTQLYADFLGGMRTNVVGVYAVGDANSDGSTNVPHAMWSGKRAAVDIHCKFSWIIGETDTSTDVPVQ